MSVLTGGQAVWGPGAQPLGLLSIALMAQRCCQLRMTTCVVYIYCCGAPVSDMHDVGSAGCVWCSRCLRDAKCDPMYVLYQTDMTGKACTVGRTCP